MLCINQSDSNQIMNKSLGLAGGYRIQQTSWRSFELSFLDLLSRNERIEDLSGFDLALASLFPSLDSCLLRPQRSREAFAPFS